MRASSKCRSVTFDIFVIALLQFWSRAFAGMQTTGDSSCSSAIPQGTATAHYVHKNVTSVQPKDIIVPPASVGNVYLDGIHAGLSSAHMTCQSTVDSLMAVVKGSGVSSMRRGSHNCSLKSVRVEKSATGEATMNFEYVNCSGMPTMGTVSVGLEQTSTGPTDDVYKFFNEVCGVRTTTPLVSMASVKMQLNETKVGNGSCDGDFLTVYNLSQNVKSKKVCRQLCISDIERYQGMKNAPNKCTGYAFNSAATTGTAVCKLYKGKPLMKATPKAITSWTCYKITETVSVRQTQTAAPPTKAQLAQIQANAPKMKAAVSAKFATVQTYISKQKCFPNFDWITLQDAVGQPATFKVSNAEWTELMKMIPSGPSRRLAVSQAVIDVKLLVDQAVYSQQPLLAQGVAEKWVAAPVSTAAPSPTQTTAAPVVIRTIVTHKDCVVPEVLNALLCGILVPVATWIALYLVQNRVLGKERHGDGNQSSIILITCAIMVAAIVSFVLVSLFAILFKPICESTSHDLTLIKLTCGVTAMMACSTGLIYFFRSHTENGKGTEKREYMMIEKSGDGQWRTMTASQFVDDDAALKTLQSSNMLAKIV